VFSEFEIAIIYLYSTIRTRYNKRSESGRKVVNDMANASSKNENPSKKLIRLLEEQLAHSNQQNKDLSKQIEVLIDQVRQLTKLLYG
jgi:hypothetical protein